MKKISLEDKNLTISVVGLGYVGLPLAVEFGKYFRTMGFDVNKQRIESLRNGHDSTNELTKKDLKTSKFLKFSSNLNDLKESNVYIVTVPTPIDENKSPDLSFLEEASKMLGECLKEGDLVIYESTVYPGATEEICLPILEKISGLKLNEDFYLGYSPERINPGDKKRKLTDIKKITSGSNEFALEIVDYIYRRIVKAGTHRTSSIKVAEAAKVIENTQRDLNIALVNELSLIFNVLDIDTEEILKAAETKWNFMPFRPGLVGGHCIGVDPYYLTHKAKQAGYEPKIILSGRALNDHMSNIYADKFIHQLSLKGTSIEGATLLVMGVTFKENCPDIRNSKVIDLCKYLELKGARVECYDPWVGPEDKERTGLCFIEDLEREKYDGIIISVGHSEFKNMGSEIIKKSLSSNGILFDLKYLFSIDETDMRP